MKNDETLLFGCKTAKSFPIDLLCSTLYIFESISVKHAGAWYRLYSRIRIVVLDHDLHITDLQH